MTYMPILAGIRPEARALFVLHENSVVRADRLWRVGSAVRRHRVNRQGRVALRLMTLMLALFGMLVWILRLIAHPETHLNWSEFGLAFPYYRGCSPAGKTRKRLPVFISGPIPIFASRG